MIQASELRIGNWLQDGFGKYYQVEIPDLALLSSRPDTKECNPIPLTPHILAKASFIKSDNSENWKEPDWSIYNYGGFKIGESNGKYCYYKQAEDDFYSSFVPEIKHVHQLQNLYFALTQTELEIKL